MSLPLGETTPVTEAIESWVDRMVESMRVLGPLAERAVSDATRIGTADTSLATTAYNVIRLWLATMNQAALTGARLAGNLVLLSAETITPLVLRSPAPLAMLPNFVVSPGEYVLAVDGLRSSNGEVGTQYVSFVRNGVPITFDNPIEVPGPAGGGLHQIDLADIHLQVAVSLGSAINPWSKFPLPTGPLSGEVKLVRRYDLTPQATWPIYLTVE